MNMLKRKPIIGLACTQDQFEDLHESLSKVRSTSTSVTVSKSALVSLLHDHAKLIEQIERLP